MTAHSLLLKIKRLDAQMIAVMIATPMAAALLAYLISIGATDLVCSNWFVSMIAMPAFLSGQISAFAHLGRMRDMYSSNGFHNSPFELVGGFTGLTLGLMLAAIFALTFISVPLLPHLGFAAFILFAFRQLNIFAGIGGRLGRCVDKNSRPFNEKVIVGVGAIFGIALSVTLFVTSSAAMVTVVGVTAFFTAGASLPLWIAGFIFIASVTSSFVSSADYGSKAYNYIRTLVDKNCDVAKRVQRFKAEYSGSLLGLCIGAVLGIITVISLAMLTPYIVPGLVGVITAALIIISTASLVATVFSQIGRVIDNFRAEVPVPVKPIEQSTPMFTLSERRPSEDTLTFIKQSKVDFTAYHLHQNPNAMFNAKTDKTCEKSADLITCETQIMPAQVSHDFTTSPFTSSPPSLTSF